MIPHYPPSQTPRLLGPPPGILSLILTRKTQKPAHLCLQNTEKEQSRTPHAHNQTSNSRPSRSANSPTQHLPKTTDAVLSTSPPLPPNDPKFHPLHSHTIQYLPLGGAAGPGPCMRHPPPRVLEDSGVGGHGANGAKFFVPCFVEGGTMPLVLKTPKTFFLAKTRYCYYRIHTSIPPCPQTPP